MTNLATMFNTNVQGYEKGWIGKKETNWHVWVDRNNSFLSTARFMVYAKASQTLSWKFQSLKEANDYARQLATSIRRGNIPG